MWGQTEGARNFLLQRTFIFWFFWSSSDFMSLFSFLPFTVTRAQKRRLVLCCNFLEKSFWIVLSITSPYHLLFSKDVGKPFLWLMTSTIFCFYSSTHFGIYWNTVLGGKHIKSVFQVCHVEIKKSPLIPESSVFIGENWP